jgi:hypothetical protein
MDDYLELTDVDFVGNIDGTDQFEGASIDKTGVIYFYDIPDLNDMENTLTGYSVLWGDNGFYDFESVDIASQPDFWGEEHYIIATVTSFSDLPPYEDQVQIPHYQIDTGAGGVSIYWFYYTDSSNAKIDVDQSSEIVYYAFQWTNETHQDVIILSSELQYVGEVEPAGWGDGMGEGRKRQVAGTANTINPAISAENGNVYAVMQTDQNGNQDIICYYSSDDGDTYSMSTIADSAEDELYPEIHCDGDFAVCTFTKGNNLYSAITEDGGKTWETGDKINDVDKSVVNDIGNSDIFEGKAIWMDDRDGYLSIYSDDAGAIAKPNVVIEAISGGIGVSATLTNIGDAEATDFDWEITLDGTVLLGGETSGTETLAPGDSTVIKSGFPLGLGAIDITVTADQKTETRTGTLILFFITGL